MVKIEIEEVNKRGLYNAYVDGELIVSGSRQPAHDTARRLLARGSAPDASFVVVGRGSTRPRLFGKIGATAAWTVSGQSRGGIRLVKFEQFDPAIRGRANG